MRLIRHACVIFALGTLAGGMLSGCGGSSSDITLQVSPHSSLMDAPLSIMVTGLAPHESAEVEVSSTDERGVSWTASANYRATGDGVITTAADPPVAGSYTGVVPMGLIMAMHPNRRASPSALYHWATRRPMQFRFTVHTPDGVIASQTVLRRGLSAGMQTAQETVANAGFDGLWVTPRGAEKRTAVLMFGGSEGGGQNGSLLQALLASHGFPTLQIAYFDAPGLPRNLEEIPLEYFATALTWMSQQREVNSQRIYIMSGSYGSEAALLLGVHYPNLVHGVVASVPSDAATTGLTAFDPNGAGFKGCECAAWTYQANPVPTTFQLNNATPTDVPGAVIPVEQIHGPILTDCGEFDHVWASCAYAEAIQSRLDAARDPYPHPFYPYSTAGHDLGTLLAYEPGLSSGAAAEGLNVSGETPLANEIADAQLWPRVLAFLSTT